MSSFPSYNQISIINKSSIVSDIHGSCMATALNALLPEFCNDWKIPLFTVIYVSKGLTEIPPNTYIIYLMDISDVDEALAYHDIRSDIPYGKVFAKTIIDNGGVLLYEPTLKQSTVAQSLSHEVFELIIDPRCNGWWMDRTTGILYASEVCDPVQSNIVVVSLKTGIHIGMSDWILPSWQDIQNTSGPYNHLNTLTAPFQIKNGYAMQIKNSKLTTVYGDIEDPVTNSHSQRGERSARRLNLVINQ